MSIFFVAFKPYGSLKNLSARALADDQMRDRFREFASGSLPTPTLVGISAFGTRFSVYTFTTETRSLQQTLVMADEPMTSLRRTDAAFYVLNNEGEAKLREW